MKRRKPFSTQHDKSSDTAAVLNKKCKSEENKKMQLHAAVWRVFNSRACYSTVAHQTNFSSFTSNLLWFIYKQSLLAVLYITKNSHFKCVSNSFPSCSTVGFIMKKKMKKVTCTGNNTLYWKHNQNWKLLWLCTNVTRKHCVWCLFFIQCLLCFKAAASAAY